ncbi:MAG: PBECR2 nuclease fold domain-containing protein [Ruminiclostridium sp.]
MAANSVHIIGKIDVQKYKCINDNIATDEVIITDERIQHIKERHKGDYELISPLFQIILDSPDYILEDSHRENTGLVLKRFTENDMRIQLILRIHTTADEDGFKNSVISAWKISERRWENYINNKKILYKSE